MAEKDNAQICDSRKAAAKAAVNHHENEKITRRAAIICRGYNRALKHRIAQVAS